MVTRPGEAQVEGRAHLLLLLVFGGGLEDGGNVVGEAERLEGLGDVVAGDGLLGLLLGNLVGLGRDKCDKLDAAFYEQVTSFFGKGDAVGGGQDLGYDLLDRCWEGVSLRGYRKDRPGARAGGELGVGWSKMLLAISSWHLMGTWDRLLTSLLSPAPSTSHLPPSWQTGRYSPFGRERSSLANCPVSMSPEAMSAKFGG